MKAKSDSIWKGGDKKKIPNRLISQYKQAGIHSLCFFSNVSNETEKENSIFPP